MKVIIAGGSSFDDYELMQDSLEDQIEKIQTIVSGRSFGADALAEKLAFQHAIDLELFPANWGKHGENAGYDRWVKVFETQKIDKVFLFWDGKSKGTKVLRDLAKRFDVTYELYYYEANGSLSA